MSSSRIAAQKFCDAWKDSFTAVLELPRCRFPGSNWIVRSKDPRARASPRPPKEDVTDRQLVCQCVADYRVVLCRCDKSVAVQFAQLLQSEPSDPTASFPNSIAMGSLNLLRQVAAHVSTHWKQETNNEVELLFDTTENKQSCPGANCLPANQIR